MAATIGAMPPPTARPPVSFVPIRTQYENLGDVQICLGLLTELRRRGELRVVGAEVPPSLVELLGLAPQEMVSRATWWTGLLGLAPGTRRVPRRLVLKPGGLVDPRNGKEGLRPVVRLVGVVAARVSGAAAVQVGYSASGLSGPWLALERIKVRLMTTARPRDRLSVERVGLDCEPVPDASVLSPDLSGTVGSATRDRVVVSLRETGRLTPSRAQAIGADVAAVAADRGLRPTVVTQVGRDAAMSTALADGAASEVAATWDEADAASRVVLYGVYAEAAVVISNRLHVLLLAWLLGARTVAVVGDEGSKIPGALATCGVTAPTVAERGGVDALGAAVDDALAVPVTGDRAAACAALAAVFDEAIGPGRSR